VALTVLAGSNTDGQEPPLGVVLQVPVPAPVQHARGSPDRMQAAFGKAARTCTVIVKPVTPEES
jgi:hypothetical protein